MPRNLNADFRLGNSLFTSVNLTMNADPDKYLYTGYAIGFNLHTDISLPDVKVGKNIIIFGNDTGASACIDNHLCKLVIRKKLS